MSETQPDKKKKLQIWCSKKTRKTVEWGDDSMDCHVEILAKYDEIGTYVILVKPDLKNTSTWVWATVVL